MKIAIVCDVLGEENNGTTVAAMNLIRFLRRRGHDVRVVCPDEKRRGEAGYYVVPQLNVGPLNEYVRKNGVSIAISDSKVLENALHDVEIIHIMTPFILGKSALEYGRKHHIPVTAGFHAQAENITNHLHLMNSRLANDLAYKTMYRLVYQYVDAIHFPTQFIREVFEKEVGPTNGYVISNGVNDRFVKTEVKRPEEWADKFVILFTGRFGLEKSHRVLIDAVAESRHAPIIQLVFAGKGPLQQELEAYGQKLSNPPVMRFFSRDEMLRVVNSADLYVHPAEIEIEAIACLEAISCGLVPVIADSPRSATRFFALEENNLFHYNDPADLARKIDYWFEHPREKEECSKAYQGYTKQFEQQHCMEEMEAMLLDIAAKHTVCISGAFRPMRRFRQQISKQECIRVLKEEKRGVLSMIGDNGYPYGIPMNHWYDPEENKLYFHSAKVGHKIDSITRNDKVSYCVFDAGYRKEGEWALNVNSVVIFGRISPVTDEEKRKLIGEHLLRKFTDDEAYIQKEVRDALPRAQCLELTIDHITGKLVNES